MKMHPGKFIKYSFHCIFFFYFFGTGAPVNSLELCWKEFSTSGCEFLLKITRESLESELHLIPLNYSEKMIAFS